LDLPAPTIDGSGRSRSNRVCLAGLVLGVATLIGGLIWGWSMAASPHVLWSPEQAAEYKAASDALHSAPHDHGNPSDENHDDEESPEQAAARERFDAIQAQLNRARYAQTSVGPLLVRIGLAGAIAFGIGYLASRP
jgi:hypothetical protein